MTKKPLQRVNYVTEQDLDGFLSHANDMTLVVVGESNHALVREAKQVFSYVQNTEDFVAWINQAEKTNYVLVLDTTESGVGLSVAMALSEYWCYDAIGQIDLLHGHNFEIAHDNKSYESLRHEFTRPHVAVG